MNIKKLIAVTLSAATFALSLTACGGKSSDSSAGSSSAAESTTVKLGVVGSIYEDLWKPAQESLKAEGIDLEIVQFSDYATPNNALNSGDIDLNAFQHQIYLDNEVEQQGYKIQSIGYTFIIPLNIYSHKVKAISDIKDGDVVAIPDDVTNGGRAIKVLAAAGLITLKEDAGFNPTLEDIKTYDTKITIKELKANTIPSVLDDVTAASRQRQLRPGLRPGRPSEAIYADDSVLDIEETYWNLIAARTEDFAGQGQGGRVPEGGRGVDADATEKVFNDTFGKLIKVGWDQDLLASK